MSSDLCKKPPEPPKKKEVKERKRIPSTQIEDKDLVSKNFRIISTDVVEYVGTTGQFISDPVRKEHLQYYFYDFQNEKAFLETRGPDLKLQPAKDVVKWQGLPDDGRSPSPLEFAYVNFSMPAPFDSLDLSKNQAVVNLNRRSSAYKVESNYNLHIPQYEKKIDSSKLPETLIPNVHMYAFLWESLLDLDLVNEDEQYKKELSYGAPESTFQKQVVSRSLNYNDYLTSFYSKIPSPQIQKSATPFKSFLVSQDDIAEYSSYSDSFKNTVNYGICIEIPFDLPKLPNASKESDFKSVFKKTNTDLNLLSFVEKTDSMNKAGISEIVTREQAEKDSLANIASENEGMLDFSNSIDGSDLLKSSEQFLNEMLPAEREYFTEKVYTFLQNTTLGTEQNRASYGAEMQNLLTWDLTSFFTSFNTVSGPDFYNFFSPKPKLAVNTTMAAQSFQMGDSLKLFLGEANEALQKYQNNSTYEFFQKLMMRAADAKFRMVLEANRAKNVSKYFEDLHETPHEVLFYIVEKSGPDGLISTHFLANPIEEEKFERRVLKYFDNQVKHGVDYSYEVFALCLVLGKKYTYSAPPSKMPVPEGEDLDKEILELDNKIWKASQFLRGEGGFVEQSGTGIKIIDEDIKIWNMSKIECPDQQKLCPGGKWKISYAPGGEKKLKKDLAQPGTALDPEKAARYLEILENLEGWIRRHNQLVMAKRSPSSAKEDALELTITTEDYLPLIRVPLFTTSGKVMDHPPVPPHVAFHPLKGKNNQIKIRIVNENTESRQVPLPITSEDEVRFAELVAFHGTDEDGRLLFTSDDSIESFEVFRTDRHPRNYQDFAGKKIKTHRLEKNYVSAMHLDSIRPNKKYYYTFRSIDAHKHVSNPTPVYEVILRDDAGFIFPEIRIVEFLEGDYFKFSDNMQKYIQIIPSAQNVFFDPDVFIGKESARELNLSDDSEKTPLGISTEPVWGKKFKLRVTSKSSGKKVDINFTFNKKHKKEQKDN